MRTLTSIAILLTLATPALAQPVPLPEPSAIGLLGIGAVGLLLGLRRKK